MKESKKVFPFGVIVLILFLGLSLYCYIIDSKAMSDLQKEYANHQLELDESKNAKKESDDAVEDVTVNDVQENTYSAKESGEKVAELENLINYENAAEVGKEIATYFGEDVDNSLFFSVSDDDYSWTFNTTYDYDNQSIPVLWTYYKDSDTKHKNLLAFVIGTYNASNDKFEDIQQHVTTFGAAEVPAD